MAADQDTVIAQLMSMGFKPEAIEEYQVAMATSTEGFSMQAATEWLLQRSQTQTNHPSRDTPTLTLSPSSLPHHTPSHPTPNTFASSQEPDVKKAMSSGGALTTHSQPLKSRYDLGEDHARDKERYAAKERDEVIRKSKERKFAETKAKNLIKQQIADDKRARQSKGKIIISPSSDRPQLSGEGREREARGEEREGEVKKKSPCSSSTCRLQIRLPTGKVLRHSLPATALLSEVTQFITTSIPALTTVTLVQPFPHHQFTDDEMNQSLLDLGLCPSASLVVPRQSSQSSSGTSQTAAHSTGLAGTGQSSTATGQTSSSSQRVLARGSGSRGQVLGRGERENVEEEMDIERVNPEIQPSTSDDGVNENRLNVEMQEDESHSHSDDDEMELESDDDNMQPPPYMDMPPRPNIRPPIGANIVPPQRRQFGGPRPPHHRPPRAQFPGFPPLGGEEIFGGEGHKLGGKEVAVLGDIQLTSHEGGRVAAAKRVRLLEAPPHTDRVRHYPAISSLVSLCTRTLVGLTASYGLPSCSSLPPLLAHILLDALQSQGRLNTRTLSAFHGCPLQSMVLDNYPYATNELVGSLWHFSSLTRLSLCSCTIITDKAIETLFPYLSKLTEFNLEGCRQLTDAIFRPIRCCVSMESLNLSHVKATDRGIRLLLHSPLTHLTKLTLSHTRITSTTLTALPLGAPVLENLAIEATEVKDLTALCQLPRLHTLNIAHCDCGGVVGSLSGCGQLKSLSLSGISIQSYELQQIKNLQLTSLTLPDRATFSDSSMETISNLPLTSLNLMDYCYVSDVGVANIVSMGTLTSLTLSKTKLTDAGMHSVAALLTLRHLSLDNTVVTDAGLMLITGLVCLESLSLSDTRVTSKFIELGGLNSMSRLAKLNLSRTAVCDRGLSRLCLPSLVMLNIDWTSVTDIITMTYLRENGCPLLTTLRNRNIGQPLPGQQLQE